MLRRNRVRRFVMTAVAATLSILAIAQSGQAYDQICINGQCGAMTPVSGSAQANYQGQDYSQQDYSGGYEENDQGVIWQTPPTGHPQEYSVASAPQNIPAQQPYIQQIYQPSQQASTDCGIQFDSAIRQDQRSAICQTIAQNPDLQGTVDRVKRDQSHLEAKGHGAAWMGMDAVNKQMHLYDGAMGHDFQGHEPRRGIAHELAHSKAYELFGSATPPPDSEIYQAMESEAAGTREYSYVDKAEQFADMYAASVTGDPVLNNFPRTKASIERLRGAS